MRVLYLLTIGVACAAVPMVSTAQFVKGNEAVKIAPDGSKRVETPPLPAVSLGTPCPASKAGCAAGGWKMLESKDGLVECTEVFARPGTCRPSTYGSEKRSRAWIVKLNGTWMQCVLPDLTGKCVSLTSLPISAVQ